MADSVRGSRPFLPPSFHKEKMDWGDSALKAPTTPPRRMPKVDRSQVNPEIVKAAEGMEAMFIDYMMKVMRQTVPKNDMDLESPATEIYQGMLDSEYSQQAAHHGGIGLAEQIIAYLDTQGYNLYQGAGKHPIHRDQAPTSDKNGNGIPAKEKP
jgi:flagellar protein FlgJ